MLAISLCSPVLRLRGALVGAFLLTFSSTVLAERPVAGLRVGELPEDDLERAERTPRGGDDADDSENTGDALGSIESGHGSGGRSSRRFGGTLGLGAILGSPSGLSAKLMFLDRSAFQIHLGYGFGRRGRFVLIGDYLFHFFGVLPRMAGVGALGPYLGVGGRIGLGHHDPVIGIRVPFGLSLALGSAPVEVFLELGLGLGLIPETAALVDGGIGARWYF